MATSTSADVLRRIGWLLLNQTARQMAPAVWPHRALGLPVNTAQVVEWPDGPEQADPVWTVAYAPPAVIAEACAKTVSWVLDCWAARPPPEAAMAMPGMLLSGVGSGPCGGGARSPRRPRGHC